MDFHVYHCIMYINYIHTCAHTHMFVQSNAHINANYMPNNYPRRVYTTGIYTIMPITQITGGYGRFFKTPSRTGVIHTSYEYSHIRPVI